MHTHMRVSTCLFVPMQDPLPSEDQEASHGHLVLQAGSACQPHAVRAVVRWSACRVASTSSEGFSLRAYCEPAAVYGGCAPEVQSQNLAAERLEGLSSETDE